MIVLIILSNIASAFMSLRKYISGCKVGNSVCAHNSSNPWLAGTTSRSTERCRGPYNAVHLHAQKKRLWLYTQLDSCTKGTTAVATLKPASSSVVPGDHVRVPAALAGGYPVQPRLVSQHQREAALESARDAETTGVSHDCRVASSESGKKGKLKLKETNSTFSLPRCR